MTTNILDFNSATPQREGQPNHAMGKEELKEQLQQRIEAVLFHLFPAGKVHHNQFLIGDIYGTPGESMKVELTGEKSGVWYDHAEGQGGDILDLWAHARGMNTTTQFRDVMADIQGWLGYGHHTPPVQSAPDVEERRSPPMDDLGPYTGKWDYTDTNGKLLACVYRYDPPGRRKEFRPLDVTTGKWQSPQVTPLYNLPEVSKASEVVLVEGEKTAQALIDIGITATTSMGSKGQIKRADWAVLKGKRITIWPDHDQPGAEYAQMAAKAMREVGVREVSVLMPPHDKPEKWDAADAIDEEMDVRGFIQQAPRQDDSGPQRRLQLQDWTFHRYHGPAPEPKWLIDGVLPVGVPGLVAAIGGAGKSMLLLDLCIKVAQIEGVSPIPSEALGGPLVPVEGTAVMLTAEDDQDEIHRRLNLLAGDMPDPRRLIVVPLPNAGGAMPLVAMGREGPVLTEAYDEIRQQLLEIPDLRLVVIDPLQSFAGGDVNSDPAAGAMFFAGLGRIAAETGATTLVAHHFKKVGNKPINTAGEAREAIRGTTALVDGGRWSYALWEVNQKESKEVCKKVSRPHARDCVFRGAVVKSNWPVDKTVRVYVRDAGSGLLIDRSADLQLMQGQLPELLDSLEGAIGQAATAGQPFTKTGGNGIYDRRSELPEELSAIGRDKLVAMTDILLEMGRAVLCVAEGSKLKKYLDIPGGEFALGVGQFQVGSGE
ncbi:AAA family ATPase [Magnetococcus sp. PR-3]|uniref:AAA family ATPase n=1 Tax=Magnetococcus sp. PR-3 TaxID=3120355 RepID=UPI002FCDEB99